jgi:two-component system sensor histidine kinase AtoS
MAAKLENFFSRMLSMEKLAMLGEFATSIAHEVRNPLAAIKTTVQALYRRESDPKRLELFRDMEKEIDRVARVVSDLVDFGRPRPPEFGVVSVREVFGRIFTLIESEAEKKGVHVSVQGDSGITLFADRDQVLQILLNLVLNAIQATPADGTVMLRASLENGRPLIEISDTGCGIAPELLARVTDPFFTTKSKGIGLGLNISKQLAELNGGKLEIASIVGRGTTVRIQFPNGKGNHV